MTAKFKIGDMVKHINDNRGFVVGIIESINGIFYYSTHKTDIKRYAEKNLEIYRTKEDEQKMQRVINDNKI